MKRISIYLLTPVLFLLAGCAKHTVTPVPIPIGTFSGQFVLIHQSTQTGLLDTVTANVVLTMSTSTGYAVTSDTTTVQAGSNGSFIINDAQYLTFNDKTAPANAKTVGKSLKIHLNGVYTYYYDGINFSFYTTSADTLGYNYILTKN